MRKELYLYLFWTSELFTISHVSVRFWLNHTILHKKSKTSVSYQLFDWIAHYMMWTCFTFYLVWGPKVFFPSWLETHKKVEKMQLPGVNNILFLVLNCFRLFVSFQSASFASQKCCVISHHPVQPTCSLQPERAGVKVLSSLRVFLVLVLCVCAFRINSSGKVSSVRIMDPPTGSSSEAYDYDLLVIGGGSGGLAVAKVSVLSSN